MVSAVVEQVYSSIFKFYLLKIKEICPPEHLKFFPSKCTKMRLVAGFCPDPLWELTASAPPDPIAGLRGRQEGSGKGKGKEVGR